MSESVILHKQRAPAQLPVPSGTDRARLDYIDGLRGFACLYVLLYHLFLLWPVSSHESATGHSILLEVLTRFAAFGNVGVDIFLGLSGFCLFYPICRKAATSGVSLTVDVPSYARRRARRILPPYLGALLLFSMLPVWSYWAREAYAFPTVGNLLAHVFLVHNFIPSMVLTIDSPLWSLALETQLYVLFPILVILFRRLGPVRLVVLTFSIALVYRGIAWYLLGASQSSFGDQFVLMNALPGRFHEFVAGMCAAFLVCQRPELSLAQSRWLRRGAVLASVLGAILAYAADKRFGTYSPLTTIFWGVLTFGLIIGAEKGVIAPLRLFTWKPLVSVGIFSYSIYLVHEPLLRLSGAFMTTAALSPLLALLVFVALAGPVILLVSRLFFIVFERPFISSRVRQGRTGRSMASIPRLN